MPTVVMAGILTIESLSLVTVFFFKRAITTWYSKQQQTMLTSTSKTEYVAVSQQVREKM